MRAMLLEKLSMISTKGIPSIRNSLKVAPRNCSKPCSKPSASSSTLPR